MLKYNSKITQNIDIFNDNYHKVYYLCKYDNLLAKKI